jgi:antitoxin component of MazEF toxin-antitoxin module
VSETAKAFKSGDSIVIAIPRRLREILGVKIGDTFSVDVQGLKLVAWLIKKNHGD